MPEGKARGVAGEAPAARVHVGRVVVRAPRGRALEARTVAAGLERALPDHLAHVSAAEPAARLAVRLAPSEASGERVGAAVAALLRRRTP